VILVYFLQTFRFFRHTVNNNNLENVESYFKIACALINAYSPKIFTDTEFHVNLAETCLERVTLSNDLQRLVIEEQLDRRGGKWLVADSTAIEDFPVLTINDLKSITLGIYQINLARRYSRQHMFEDKYSLSVLKENHTTNNLHIIRAKIESRFRSNSGHLCWIQYLPNSTGPKSIEGWHCQCKVGARVVGCCSHVASVIWFMGFYRHQNVTEIKPYTLTDRILDASEQLDDVSSSDED